MELAQLDAHLTTALAGQGHTVFVAGDAGEGKSLLTRNLSTMRELRSRSCW
ncbi:MAG: hypothetical protein KDE31_28285 [Caldilineaceae bacterium]|nr:hypothetical protein [Caldilineaceae bacterium]MCB0188213.1 hypothetical protein [Caldilineaceae bacterium]